MPETHFDFVIIGAGIAGASLAAELSSQASVALLDMEAQPGYHATGRSAAYFAPSYGNETIREFTRLSAQTYADGEKHFGVEVLKPRASLFIATSQQASSLGSMLSEQPDLTTLNMAQVQTRVPIINSAIQQGLLDATGGDLDVDAILQGYLKRFRANNGSLLTRQKVVELKRQANWHVTTESDTLSASIVVNAAGAWADQVAASASLGKLNITPKRRTALLVDPPPGFNTNDWPLVVDVDESFYFKPDAGKLLLSPADETPTEAADVFPEEIDIAIAIDRVCSVTNLQVRAVNHQWAGLRTFAEDKSPVVGFDPRTSGFFWLAGQGGYGVQTAPGVAKFASQLCLQGELDREFNKLTEKVAPDRLI